MSFYSVVMTNFRCAALLSFLFHHGLSAAVRSRLISVVGWGLTGPAMAAQPESFESSALQYTLLLLVLVVSCGFLTLLISYLSSVSFRRLHRLLTAMPMAVAIVRSKDGQLVYANRACRELLGVRKINDRYLYPDALSATMLCDFLRPLASLSEFVHVRDELPGVDGKPIALSISGQAIRCRWQDCWLLSIVPDKAAQRNQIKLEEEPKLFQQVLNSLSELVYFQNNAGEVIGTNKAFDRFWRGRYDEGMESIKEVGRIGNSASHTWTTAPDGTSRLLESNRTQLVDDNGGVFGTLSISHDVTDWHEMQEVLKSEIEKREITEQELAQRNSLLDTILSASRDPIGMYNEQGVYVICNEPFARALGHTQTGLLGKSARDVLTGEQYESFCQTDQKVINEGRSIKTDDFVVLEDGTPIWYEVLKSPYLDPTDGTNGVLVMARDVTERKMAEQQLADAIMELQELSFVDSLTKVANRRSFDEQMRKLWFSHMREQQPLTLILCDIDYFKAFNDNYGHQQGDFALREVAKIFSSVIKRETDEVARYGGEEFAFLLPNTDLPGGEVVAAEIHQALADVGLTHLYSEVDTKLTVSLGVATLTPQPNQDYGELVEMADIALYKAKAAGRNCTMSLTAVADLAGADTNHR